MESKSNSDIAVLADFKVAFLGTNGSCAYNNGKRIRYGTNTLCTVIKAGKTILIFDAGSGICRFNQLSEFDSDKINLFFSHYHIDHMNGLLFWSFLFNPQKEIKLYGQGDIRKVVGNFFTAPYQPVSLNDFRATMTYHDIKSYDEIKLADNGSEVKIKTLALNHPNDCLGYRIDYKNRSVCYLTDIELANYENQEKAYNELVEFAKDSDLLIIDAAYANGKNIKGFGHSTPFECANLASNANAKKLALYHYGYMETDDGIDTLVESAKEVFSNTLGSYDGLSLNI